MITIDITDHTTMEEVMTTTEDHTTTNTTTNITEKRKSRINSNLISSKLSKSSKVFSRVPSMLRVSLISLNASLTSNTFSEMLNLLSLTSRKVELPTLLPDLRKSVTFSKLSRLVWPTALPLPLTGKDLRPSPKPSHPQNPSLTTLERISSSTEKISSEISPKPSQTMTTKTGKPSVKKLVKPLPRPSSEKLTETAEAPTPPKQLAMLMLPAHGAHPLPSDPLATLSLMPRASHLLSSSAINFPLKNSSSTENDCLSNSKNHIKKHLYKPS